MQDLQQRLEAAAAFCRATSAAAVAAASLSPTSSDRPQPDTQTVIWPSVGLLPRGFSVTAALPEIGAAAAATAAEGVRSFKKDVVSRRPLAEPDASHPSSQAQLESLKQQIERLRENLGAFTEGLLHAHESKMALWGQHGHSALARGAHNKETVLYCVLPFIHIKPTCMRIYACVCTCIPILNCLAFLHFRRAPSDAQVSQSDCKTGTAPRKGGSLEICGGFPRETNIFSVPEIRKYAV